MFAAKDSELWLTWALACAIVFRVHSSSRHLPMEECCVLPVWVLMLLDTEQFFGRAKSFCLTLQAMGIEGTLQE